MSEDTPIEALERAISRAQNAIEDNRSQLDALTTLANTAKAIIISAEADIAIFQKTIDRIRQNN